MPRVFHAGFEWQGAAVGVELSTIGGGGGWIFENYKSSLPAFLGLGT